MRLSQRVSHDFAGRGRCRKGIHEARSRRHFELCLARGHSVGVKPDMPDRSTPARSVIAVDWSGNAADRGTNLWLAQCVDGELVDLRGGWTRQAVIRHILETIEVEPATVVGLDFSFGFPAWFVDRQGWSSASEMWADVGRLGEEWLRNCQPPFWGRAGCPRGPEKQFRRTELAVASRWNARPSSTFQIGGAGAVGTGSLRGMPFLGRLHAAGVRVWPFVGPAGAAEPPLVVELYPRLLTGPVIKRNGEARARFLTGMAGGSARHNTLLRLAERSEDAFDAAVSALVMYEHHDLLAGLAPPVNRTPVAGHPDLEGEIWQPPTGPVSGAVLAAAQRAISGRRPDSA
jgi:hypothetical protein